MNFINAKLLIAIIAILSAIFGFLVISRHEDKAKEAAEEQQHKAFARGGDISIKKQLEEMRQETQKNSEKK